MNKATKLTCRIFLTGAFAIGFILNGLAMQKADTAISIPLGGNGWLSANAKAKITDAGLTNWSAIDEVVSVYMRPEAAGKLNVALRLRVPAGSSKISINAIGQTLTTTAANRQFALIDFGSITVKEPGYIKFDIHGVATNGAVIADIADLVLKGPALINGAAYVKDNKGNFFYWGHRGPSVHLNYTMPAEVKNTAEWFYNEVTVPMGQDIMSSYFMADGFTGGYFGMQVNSPETRHVLFSVWSPFKTDDPKSIPDSMKVKLMKKGANVHGGEFGGEGSGGQSYMNYPWVAGKTYCFLMHAQADETTKTTIFTAYFKPADQTEWQLVASFKRPQSGAYLKGLHSFLENFEPENGNVSRKVFFGNQWVIDTANKWYPVTDALFTGDNTANVNYRKDYAGGVENDLFYLRNCGFFNDYTKLKSPLKKTVAVKAHPEIDFKNLP